ncbi:hypothetical protein RND71_022921 [Anisodus tanguticus]|uniref:Uncharacterized protein n=1 Tax=Anisodus tanguticus TaxID=243964 RepID=A0AAE1VB55_9SOLA|nr:hypothetical protein RND71_022921 [Anisodus tanguticus]
MAALCRKMREREEKLIQRKDQSKSQAINFKNLKTVNGILAFKEMVEMINHQEMNISSRSSTFVDVSSFLLFECTGDSEFDSKFYSTSDPMDSYTLNPSHQRFLEDDDAQSCNEDMDLDYHIENEDNNDDNDDDDVDSLSCSRDLNRKRVGWNSDMEDEDEDEDEDDDDEGDAVEQRWMNDVNRCKKSKSNVSSVDCELKNQKDKDKLFWETCLAS